MTVEGDAHTCPDCGARAVLRDAGCLDGRRVFAAIQPAAPATLAELAGHEPSPCKVQVRAPRVVVGYGERVCTCCGVRFKPVGATASDCSVCIERIPYRLRRLGRQVAAWSPCPTTYLTKRRAAMTFFVGSV